VNARRNNNIAERIKNGNKLFPGKVFCPIIFIVQISTPKDKNKMKSNIKAL
jgi:hypothetical protein